MPPKFSSNITKQRLRDVVNHYERSPNTTAPKPLQPDGGVLPSQEQKIDLKGRTERFLLTEEISSGKLGFGLRLARVPDPTFVEPTTDSDGNEVTEENILAYRWLVTRQEETLCVQGGLINAYPVGSVVTAIYNGEVWMVIGGEFSIRTHASNGVQDLKPFSLMTYFMTSSDGGTHVAPVGYTPWDLDEPTDDSVRNFKPWLSSYFATGGDPFYILDDNDMWAEQGTFEDGESVPHRVCGAPLLGQPVKVRYTPFDGTIDNSDDPLPEELSQWLETKMDMEDDGGHPTSGLFWGPGTDGSLVPRIVALPLWWYSWETPDWVVVTRTVLVDNPDYEGGNDFAPTTAYEATCLGDPQVWNETTQDYDPNPAYDPDNVICKKQIEEDKQFWATPGECTDDGVPISTEVESSEDPPEKRYAYWIAPRGYWGAGYWDYGYYAKRFWRYAGEAYPYGFTNWYWGSRGYWWNSYNGFPPSRAELSLADLEEDPPEPPCGQVQRRHLYGYVVWNWGWNVVGANKDTKTAFISGTINTRTEVVIINSDPPEPSNE